MYNRKIAIITPSNIGPYHFARFSKLAHTYTGLHVFGIVGKEIPRPWSVIDNNRPFKFTIIQNKAGWKYYFNTIKNMVHLLEGERPEAIIIVNYNNPVMLAAACWAKKNQVPCICHADSWQGDRPRRWIKELAKRHLIMKPWFDAAFVSGHLSYQYINSLGIPEDAIWKGVDVVDNVHFSNKAEEARKAQIAWRSEFKLPVNYFITISRFTPEKNIVRLLKAFARYCHQGGQWNLVIVGGGPQENELQRLAFSLVSDKATFVSWKQYEELPVFYALANCFVLASIDKETWGLVVNEAMACGLPVLVSRKCGCFPELCLRGVNGFDFDPLDVEGLARLMLWVSSGEVDLNAMGEASRRIISNFTLETWVQTLQNCIETTIDRCQLKHGTKN